MMRFGRILTLALIAAPVLAFGWAYGGMRAPEIRLLMPGFSLGCALAILLLPQRHRDEGWCAAERRVLKGLVRDPFFWVALAFVGYLTIPLFNVSLSPIDDWQAIASGTNPYPPYRYLPFCANRLEHIGVIWWFVPSFLSALGVRHALVRSGRRAFYGLLVWQGAALALLGILQAVTGATQPYWEAGAKTGHFFSVFGYPNMGGAYFALSYALALGFWCHRMDAVDTLPLTGTAAAPRFAFLRRNYPFVAVLLTLVGALGTLCRAAILQVAVLTALFVLYLFLHAFAAHDWLRMRRFKSAVAASLLVFALLGAILVYAPPEVVREAESITSFEVANRVTGKGQYHTRVAARIMRDFPFFGTGGWGYRHFGPVYMTEKELPQQQITGGINVHNDYLQFLVEFGLVGSGLLAACAWLLALPALRAWRAIANRALEEQRKRLSNVDVSLVAFLVEPPLFWAFCGSVLVLVHAFGDCPLRAGSVLSELLVVLPVATGFLTPAETRLGEARHV